MLRVILIALATFAVLVCAGIFLLGQGSGTAVAAWIGFEAVLLLIALVAERGRYRPRTSDGAWTRTTERFQDPASGRWTVVEFNPATGERRYVEEAADRSRNS